MTIKQELLNFMIETLNESNFIQLHSVLVSEQSCSMEVKVPKARAIEIITDFFDDDLNGHMPYGSIQHRIIGWNIFVSKRG